jgi:hypothetical protein
VAFREQCRGGFGGRVDRPHREAPGTGRTGLEVRPVFLHVEREFVGLEDRALRVDGPEIEADLLGLDAEFVEYVRELSGDLPARFEHGRVLGNGDRPVHDARRRADLLELADERARIDPGVALGDHDVVRGLLSGIDRSRRLRGF